MTKGAMTDWALGVANLRLDGKGVSLWVVVP